ncbi:MAG: IclR family transcriptional regulator [Chloroflexi bacterium]|nr:MAG: IclR family transcriptional regulator [Chloroflexota bacterium]
MSNGAVRISTRGRPAIAGKSAVAPRRSPKVIERPNASALAVERAAEIMFLLAEWGDGSVSELAETTGSTGSAVHRILTALKRKDLVAQDEDSQRYTLAWSVLSLARSLSARADVRTLAHPRMVRLRDLTEETATLNVRSGLNRVCIEQVESGHEVRWVAEIGRIVPLHSGVTGKVLLAFATPKETGAYLRSLSTRRQEESGVPDSATLANELEEIRHRGYALAVKDRVRGISAISAPIPEPGGMVSAALTLAGPAERCTLEKLKAWAPHLTKATREISDLLGRSRWQVGVDDAAAR